ncbi:MAG: hypothetical protein WC638_02950 [Candidatus Paceibacterota bacterium]|jgi:hypothetical protein
MPEKAPIRQPSRNSANVNHVKIAVDASEKKMVLHVLRAELEISGLQESYVRKLKKFEHKLTSFETVELSEEEKKFVIALMEVFAVLGGQKWSEKKIYELHGIYRDLGGCEFLPRIWSYWKTLSSRRRVSNLVVDICPRCGCEITQLRCIPN